MISISNFDIEMYFNDFEGRLLFEGQIIECRGRKFAFDIEIDISRLNFNGNPISTPPVLKGVEMGRVEVEGSESMDPERLRKGPEDHRCAVNTVLSVFRLHRVRFRSDLESSQAPSYQPCFESLSVPDSVCG